MTQLIEEPTKGGNQTLKLNELLEKYSKTVEDLDFDYESMSDEELEAKFAELFEGTEDPDEPVKEPVADPEADPESNDNSEFSNKKRYTKKENGNTEVTFEIN